MNTFGHIYRLTTFGESHGTAVGGVIDGMPAGLRVDMERVQTELDRRRPGQSHITTARREEDRVEVLSGLFGGVTSGTPIAFEVRNADHRSADYGNMAHTFRPSHADFTYAAKYGAEVRDYRGGGRSSARETLSRVVAGAFARQALELSGVTVAAYTSRVGHISLDTPYTELDLASRWDNAVRCPDAATAGAMEQLIEQVKSEGDTVGGIITGVISGLPAGVGSPVFGKLHARLASAMMGINAAKAFEYGMGMEGCCRRGSEMIDTFATDASGRIVTLTNHSGGVQGGISNGADIYFRVAFKPVATLLREVAALTDSGESVTLRARGRHDPCVLPRAVPVVEAMAAITVFDALLESRCDRI